MTCKAVLRVVNWRKLQKVGVDLNITSFVYQELSAEEMEKVMASVFPEESVLSWNLLSGGLFNTT